MVYLVVSSTEAGCNTDITFSNMTIKYTKKQQKLLNQLSNKSTGGVGTEVSKVSKSWNKSSDPHFPVLDFEKGFEAMDGKFYT